MLAVTKFGRIFRNNVGRAWAGKARQTNGDGVFIENARPFHAGLCVGSSDLIGWTATQINGESVAIFTAIEVKTATGKPTKEQIKFIEAVNNAGGIAGVCRSPREAEELIQSKIKTISKQ